MSKKGKKDAALLTKAQQEEVRKRINQWLGAEALYTDTITEAMTRVKGALPEEMNDQRRAELVKMSVTKYHQDVYYRNAIETIVALVCGRKIVVKLTQPNTKKLWDAFSKRNNLDLKFRQAVRTTLVTGESFWQFYSLKSLDNAAVRLINPLNVTEIETNPQDFEEVKTITVGKGDKERTVKASDLVFWKIDPFGTRIRGVPLAPAGTFKKLDRYDMHEYTRMLLDIIRSSVPLVHKVPGTVAQVAEIAKKTSKMPAPGSKVTMTSAESLEFPNLHINAADTVEDGNMLLRGVAASMSLTMDMMSGQVDLRRGQHQLEAGSAVVKFIEGLQVMFEEYIGDIVEKIVPKDTEYEIDFPRVAQRNLQSDVQGIAEGLKRSAIPLSYMSKYFGMDFRDEVLEQIREEREALNALPQLKPQMEEPGAPPAANEGVVDDEDGEADG